MEEEKQAEAEAQTQVWKHIYGFAESFTLKCAIDLEIPDILHKHGEPIALSKIAQEISSPSLDMDRLHRIMRFLVYMKVFDVVVGGPEKKYALTPVSKLLVKAEEKNMASYALMQLHEKELGPWHHLISGVVGEMTPSMAFEKESPNDGNEKEQKFLKLCNDGMSNQLSFLAPAIVEGCAQEGVLDGVRTLLDVGEHTGMASKAIANAFPNIKCTVMDLPHAIENVPSFEFVPKADAVLIKSFLHWYSDDDCIKILKKFKDAIPSKGGKVIIAEIVTDMDGAPEFAGSRLCMDMEMFVFGGKERTKDEWKNLLTKAGFGTQRIIPITVKEALIVAYP